MRVREFTYIIMKYEMHGVYFSAMHAWSYGGYIS